MLYKENKPEKCGDRKLGKNSGGSSKTRRVPFFNERDFRVFAAVNGIRV
jgi:hypothetical protein